MSSVDDTRTLADDLLARASDDWVSAAEVIDLVRASGLTRPDDLRDLAVGLIARLIAADLIVAGDYDGVSHRPWECSAGVAIGRLVSDWTSRRDPFVMPGEVVWLDTTPEGQLVGEIIRRRDTEHAQRSDGRQ